MMAVAAGSRQPRQGTPELLLLAELTRSTSQHHSQPGSEQPKTPAGEKGTGRSYRALQ